MNWVLYFWFFLKGSLFSTGGFGNLPFLHQDLIAHGWATEEDFVQAMAVGQISPGPNGLWTVSLGYLTGGWFGAVLSMIAITVPTLLVIALAAAHRRVENRPSVRNFTRGLSLGVIGLILGVAWSLFGSNVTDWRGAAITVLALGLSLTRRVPALAVLGIGALAGWVLFRAG
jgi:chromate transporter